MLARVLILILVVGCGPELERPTDLADFEVSELSMYIGSSTMWGDLRPVRDVRDPCAILGEDFHARIGELELSTFPGEREDLCEDEDPQDCEDTARCISPFVELAWPPPLPSAELVIADSSRSITCRLGDAFAARPMTRVAVDTWNTARGEIVTVRVSPASDVTRFVTDVYFAPKGQPLLPAAHTYEGDTLTFRIPSTLGSGPQTLYVHLDGDESPDCDVPARATHSYAIEQPITVQ